MNTVAYRDQYPSVVIDIKDFKIEDISASSNIAWLRESQKILTINGNVKFVIHEYLSGIIQDGKFRIWYDRPDSFDRYVKLLMVEQIFQLKL
jgi:hypothetical protein